MLNTKGIGKKKKEICIFSHLKKVYIHLHEPALVQNLVTRSFVYHLWAPYARPVSHSVSINWLIDSEILGKYLTPFMDIENSSSDCPLAWVTELSRESLSLSYEMR